MENQNSSDPQLKTSDPDHRFALILTFCAISLIFIGMVINGNFIFGSESGNFIYPYFHDFRPIPAFIPLLTTGLLAGLIFLGSRLLNKKELLAVLLAFFVLCAVQFLIHSVYPYIYGLAILSKGANSFYTVSIQYPFEQILREFELLTSSFPLHARSNMPGKILFFQLLGVFTRSPQRMGYLIVIASTFGGLFLYGICRLLFKDRWISYSALILYALLPSKLFFFPILNTVTPVFILLSLLLFIAYLEKRRVIFLVLLGATLYGMVFFEPSPLVLGILFASILAHYLVTRKIPPHDVWKIVLVPLGSFLAVYLTVHLVFSFDLFNALGLILKDAVDFNSRAGRPYGIWLWENSREFFYSTGLPIMMIFLYLVIDHFSHLRSLTQSRKIWSIEIMFFLGLLVTFLFVLFLGINRGEVTRLWIYLAVLFQIPAAQFISRSRLRNWAVFAVILVLVAQSIVALQRVFFVNPGIF